MTTIPKGIDSGPELFSHPISDEDWVFIQSQRSGARDRDKFRRICNKVEDIKTITCDDGHKAVNEFCALISGSWYRIWTNER